MRPTHVLLLLIAAGIAAFLLMPTRDTGSPSPRTDESDPTESPLPSEPSLRGHTDEQVPRTLDGPWRLRGVVLRTDGEPAGDVAVVLTAGRKEARRAFHRDPRLNIQAERRTAGETLQTTRSAKDGSFVLTGLHVDRSYVIRATPPEPRVGSVVRVSLHEPLPRSLTLYVFDAVPVSGRVVDAGGGGVVALVAAHLPSDSDEPPPADCEWWTDETQTDPRGRFTLLVPPGLVHLDVRARGNASVGCWPLRAGRDADIRIRLGHPAGAMLEGHVRDADGLPIAGATVLVAPHVPTSRDRWTYAMTASAADGSYRLADLTPGPIRGLYASAPGFVASDSLQEDLELASGTTTRAAVRLLRGGTIQGRITNPNGRPLRGVEVTAFRADPMPPHRVAAATTAADGRYRLDAILPGPARVDANLPGWFVPERPAVSGNRLLAVIESAGKIPVHVQDARQVIELDIVLTRGTRVTGTVFGPDGRPAQGAVVTAARADSLLALFSARPANRQVTDAGGRFDFPALEPAGDWTFQARAGPLTSVTLENLTVPTSDVHPPKVELHLAEGSTLAGRVIGPEGKPVARLPLEIRDLDQELLTSPQGEFAFEHLPAGTHTIRLGPSLSASPRVEVTYTVTTGEARTDLEAEFPNTLAITGLVLDEGGEPLPGATLWVTPAPRPGHSSRQLEYADASGRFEIPWLGPGSYRFEVNDVHVPDAVEAGSRDVQLIRRSGDLVVLDGVVRGPDDEPIGSAELHVTVGDLLRGGEFKSARVMNGRFRVALPGSRAAIVIEVLGARTQAGAVLNVRPFKLRLGVPPDRPLTVRLEAGLSVSGQVVDPEGRGVAGATVRVQSAESGPAGLGGLRSVSATTRSGGRFEIGGFGKGDVWLRVEPTAPWAVADTIYAQPGEPVTIRLVAATVLRGRVLSPSGSGVAGARIGVFSPNQEKTPANIGIDAEHVAVSASDGRFEVLGLAPGNRQLLVSGPGGAAGRRWRFLPLRKYVDVGQAVIDLQLEEGVRIAADVFQPDGKPARNCSVLGEYETGAQDRLGTEPDFEPIEVGGHRFVSSPVRPGGYRLTARTEEEYGQSEGVFVTVPGGTARLVLSTAWLVHGRLVGEDVAGFEVTFLSGGGTELGSTRSGPDGAFVIKSARDAVGRLYAVRDGDLRCALVEEVRPSGGHHSLVLAEGYRIAGRVVGLQEAANPSDYVSVEDDRGVSHSVRIEVDGRFSVSGLPSGEYRLVFWGTRLSDVDVEAPKRVAAGRTNLRLPVKPR